MLKSTNDRSRRACLPFDGFYTKYKTHNKQLQKPSHIEDKAQSLKITIL